jgi:hypothetical protein
MIWVRSRIVLLLILASVFVPAAALAASRPTTGTTSPAKLGVRCAVVREPGSEGPLGIYVTAGKVSCEEATLLTRMAFTKPGKPVPGQFDFSHYPDGWYCGGQMGIYDCRYPYPIKGLPAKDVAARQCRGINGVGCPRSLRRSAAGRSAPHCTSARPQAPGGSAPTLSSPAKPASPQSLPAPAIPTDTAFTAAETASSTRPCTASRSTVPAWTARRRPTSSASATAARPAVKPCAASNAAADLCTILHHSAVPLLIWPVAQTLGGY